MKEVFLNEKKHPQRVLSFYIKSLIIQHKFFHF